MPDNFIYYWPCGSWCYPSELEELINPPIAFSDDFQRIAVPDGVEDVDIWLLSFLTTAT
jgi:hypothetical protein